MPPIFALSILAFHALSIGWVFRRITAQGKGRHDGHHPVPSGLHKQRRRGDGVLGPGRPGDEGLGGHCARGKRDGVAHEFVIGWICQVTRLTTLALTMMLSSTTTVQVEKRRIKWTQTIILETM